MQMAFYCMGMAEALEHTTMYRMAYIEIALHLLFITKLLA